MRSILLDDKTPGALIFRVLALAARSLPPVRGLGRIGQSLMRLASRWTQGPVAVRNRGAWIVAEPVMGTFDQVVVFLPQFDHRRELDFVLDHLGEGDVFVDVGANIGKFALPAAVRVGASGHVIAIEPEQENLRLLRSSIELNGFRNVEVHEVAVATTAGQARLTLAPMENRGAHTLVGGAKDGPAIDVEVVRLIDLVPERPTVLKTDIEGLDEEVILDFLASGPGAPEFIVAEQMGVGPDTAFAEALVAAGYVVVDWHGRNLMLALKQRPSRGSGQVRGVA